jgi:hypothetical protein
MTVESPARRRHRHCEERSDEAIQSSPESKAWIASPSGLASPIRRSRNDGEEATAPPLSHLRQNFFPNLA